jgi:hypothetical protein
MKVFVVETLNRTHNVRQLEALCSTRRLARRILDQLETGAEADFWHEDVERINRDTLGYTYVDPDVGDLSDIHVYIFERELLETVQQCREKGLL